MVAAKILAAALFAIPGAARAQETPGPALDVLVARLPLVNRAVEEMAASSLTSIASFDVREDIWRARRNQAQRQDREDTIALFERLAARPTEDLMVLLKNHRRVTGRVLSANDREFKIRPWYSRKEVAIGYREVAPWNLEPKASTQALQMTALSLITIPLSAVPALGRTCGMGRLLERHRGFPPLPMRLY